MCGQRAPRVSRYRPPTGLVLSAAEVHPCQALWGPPPPLPQPAAPELLLCPSSPRPYLQHPWACDLGVGDWLILCDCPASTSQADAGSSERPPAFCSEASVGGRGPFPSVLSAPPGFPQSSRPLDWGPNQSTALGACLSLPVAPKPPKGPRLGAGVGGGSAGSPCPGLPPWSV